MDCEKPSRSSLSSKTVRFCEPLVTSVLVVPAVEDGRLPRLFYTAEQINCFKREIRNILRRRVWFDLKKLDVWPSPLISDEDKDKFYYSSEEISRYEALFVFY